MTASAARKGGDPRVLEMQRVLIRAVGPGDQLEQASPGCPVEIDDRHCLDRGDRQAEGSDGSDATQMLRPVLGA